MRVERRDRKPAYDRDLFDSFDRPANWNPEAGRANLTAELPMWSRDRPVRAPAALTLCRGQSLTVRFSGRDHGEDRRQ
jgi:hypothetical protein